MPAKKKQQITGPQQSVQNQSTSQKVDDSNRSQPQSAEKHEVPKYAPPQPSIFAEYLWFPFYDTFVKLYPRCFSPNGITLFGIFSTLFASLLLLAGMPVRPTIEGIVDSSSVVSESERNGTISYLASYDIFPSVENENISNTQDFTVAACKRINAYRDVSIAANSSSPAYIHGKPIAVVPDAVALAAAESFRIAKEGPRSPSWLATDETLGKYWDFARPKLLHEVLECPLARFEVAFSIFWKSAFKFYFAIQDKLVGYRATNYHRSRYVEVIEGPLKQYYHQTRHFVELTFQEKVLPVLRLFVPAEVLVSPGRIMLIIAGILNLVYCVADNTDGRHARRTKKSSYVGEYLDHGLDCVTSLLTTYLLVSAFGIEGAQATVALFVVATVTVMSHIVNQEKGFMIWGNRLFTVDEAMLAFGFGMIAVGLCPSWIPTAVPVEALKTMFDVPVEYIPTSLAHVRVGELLWFGFLFSQVSVGFTLLGVDPTVFFRPSSATLLANVAAITYLTNTVPRATVLYSDAYMALVHGAVEMSSSGPRQALSKLPISFVEMLQSIDASLNFLFSFEALWVIMAACTCSLVIHAPIFAKCFKVQRGTNNMSYLLALPIVIYIFFFVSAGLGALVAVFAHVIQVRVNVKKLNTRGKALAEQAAKSS